MPRRSKGSVPSLVHHKPSGRARVRINGRDHWLGKWGSPESRLAYDRIIAEYLATRHVRDPETPPAEPTVVTIDPGTAGAAVTAPSRAPAEIEDRVSTDATVAEVVLRYLEYCDTYYRTPTGERTSTYGNAMQAAQALRPFDDTPAAKFGPRKLSMIRDSEAARGRPRVGCNALVKHIRRVFQWAESQELVPRGTQLAEDRRAAASRADRGPRITRNKASRGRRRRGDPAVSARHRRRHGPRPATHRRPPRRSLQSAARRHRPYRSGLEVEAATPQDELTREGPDHQYRSACPANPDEVPTAGRRRVLLLPDRSRTPAYPTAAAEPAVAADAVPAGTEAQTKWSATPP